jgi:hypothetical protein
LITRVSFAWKMLLSAGLPVALLVGATGAGFRSLAATDAGARRTLRRAVQVVHEAAAADEAASAATRLQTRWSVIRSSTYEELWADRMGELHEHLRALAQVIEGGAERRRLASVAQAFARYRALTSAESDGSLHLRVLSPVDLRAALGASARARRLLASLGRGLEATAHAVEARALASERDTWAMLRAASALAALLAVLLSGWMAIRLTRALRRLTWASEALERGRLDEPVGIGGRDELARLGSALEALALDLLERDRVGDDLLHRLGDDLDVPLRAIRDTTRRLAGELATAGTSQQRGLAAAIGDEAERLLRRTSHLGDARPDAPELGHAAPPPIAFVAPALLVDGTQSEDLS